MHHTSSAWGGHTYLVVSAIALTLLGSMDLMADDANPDDPSAEQIVEKMAKVYADCKSYQDSGIVRTLFFTAAGKNTSDKIFSTAFVRPGQFRFEFIETNRKRDTRYIVWSDEMDVQTWWDLMPGIRKAESLELGLAGATGVSGGSAHTIPALLLPKKVGGRKLSDLIEVKRIADGKLGKIDCYRVEGKFPDVPQLAAIPEFVSEPTLLWIDKKTHLVRRIDEKTKFETFRTETSTTYNPTIDEKVADKSLEFNPPAEK